MPENQFDVAIIGAGLGGLQCAYILAKNGFNVCVLEKNAQIGGCLQSFRRQNLTFDTGFHFVGGLEENQPLHRAFSYFHLLDLPWKKMDDDFAQVFLNNSEYRISQTHQRFIETLSEQFPENKQSIQDFSAFLHSLGNNIFYPFTHPKSALNPYFSQSAYEFLQQKIANSRLESVLSATSLILELKPEKTPLYDFAQINNSFISSSFRLKGGAQQIANRLAQQIKAFGSTILTNSPVISLLEKNGTVIGALTPETQISASKFISDIHPSATLRLLPTKLFRPIYSRRINSLPNSFGMFTLHLALKPNAIPYQNRNFYVYPKRSPWQIHQDSDFPSAILVSFYPPENDEKYASQIDILAPLDWSKLAEWQDSSPKKRPESYINFKYKLAQKLIDIVDKYIPIKASISAKYTSTPLTYRDFTASPNGSAYGIQKDFKHPLTTILSPITPISNLFLTGQNLNLHGILGTTMTSFLTCAQILSYQKIAKELNL